jgi:hypothetical protein
MGHAGLNLFPLCEEKLTAPLTACREFHRWHGCCRRSGYAYIPCHSFLDTQACSGSDMVPNRLRCSFGAGNHIPPSARPGLCQRPILHSIGPSMYHFGNAEATLLQRLARSMRMVHYRPRNPRLLIPFCPTSNQSFDNTARLARSKGAK